MPRGGRGEADRLRDTCYLLDVRRGTGEGAGRATGPRRLENGVRTPRTRSSRRSAPSLTAARNVSQSRRFCSAYMRANETIARSNASDFPKYP